MALNSADVQARLAAAIQAEAEAASHHKRTTAAAVLAGLEGSPEEKQAAKAHAEATAATARLQEALAAILSAEQSQRSRLERDALDAADAGCLKAVQDLQTAADRVTASLEQYVKGWTALLSTGDVARKLISENPRLRGDLIGGLPSATDLVAQELTRIGASLAVTPPGSKDGLRLHGNVADLQPLATRLDFIAEAVVSDLSRAKALRDRRAAVEADWTREA
jgi:hypothetical protein